MITRRKETNGSLEVCIVGHGMMGAWHARSLRALGCSLRSLVGRRPEPTRLFAEQYGFATWTTDLKEALADEGIDIVVVANPSEKHAETALLALNEGKHVLLEIPIALSFSDAELIVSRAADQGVLLGAVHPLRARPELVALRQRIEAGQESVRHITGRLYIHRVENIGATGYQRSWTDNLLWHHMTHVVDAGMWLLGTELSKLDGFMPPADPHTGIPMDACIVAETHSEQSLVCTGSYYSRERLFELFVITDLDSYRLDLFGHTMTTKSGVSTLGSEEETCALLTAGFVAAVERGRDFEISGRAVLSSMRVIELIQGVWDQRYGERTLPGRPVAKL